MYLIHVYVLLLSVISYAQDYCSSLMGMNTFVYVHEYYLLGRASSNKPAWLAYSESCAPPVLFDLPQGGVTHACWSTPWSTNPLGSLSTLWINYKSQHLSCTCKSWSEHSLTPPCSKHKLWYITPPWAQLSAYVAQPLCNENNYSCSSHTITKPCSLARGLATILSFNELVQQWSHNSLLFS